MFDQGDDTKADRRVRRAAGVNVVAAMPPTRGVMLRLRLAGPGRVVMEDAGGGSAV